MLQFDLSSGCRISTDLHGAIYASDVPEQRMHPTFDDGDGWIWYDQSQFTDSAHVLLCKKLLTSDKGNALI